MKGQNGTDFGGSVSWVGAVRVEGEIERGCDPEREVFKWVLNIGFFGVKR